MNENHSARRLKAALTAVALVLTMVIPLLGFGKIASAQAIGSQLPSGGYLRVGQALVSPNGQYGVYMQPDGNLVEYEIADHYALWASNTPGSGATYLALQPDFNAVLYTPAGRPAWATNTVGSGGVVLAVQDDGNVVLYRANGTPAWATNTSLEERLQGERTVLFWWGASRYYSPSQTASLQHALKLALDLGPFGGGAAIVAAIFSGPVGVILSAVGVVFEGSLALFSHAVDVAAAHSQSWAVVLNFSWVPSGVALGVAGFEIFTLSKDISQPGWGSPFTSFLWVGSR